MEGHHEPHEPHRKFSASLAFVVVAPRQMVGAAQVTSNSTDEEVEDVDVTFSGEGGVSDFLAARPPRRLFPASR